MNVKMPQSLGHLLQGHLAAVVLLILLNNCSDTSARTFPVHWNTSNPIFRIDNTDNIFDVNVGYSPQEYDQANIWCPYYSKDETNRSKEEYIIYSVTREEYETCQILNPKPRIVAECRSPHRQLYFTITFRTFTPSPGGMEFRPNQDYFFISTSDPDNLHGRSGGRCSTHNMKVVFKTAEMKTKKNHIVAGKPEVPEINNEIKPETTTVRNWRARPPTPPIVTNDDVTIESNDVYNNGNGFVNVNPLPKMDPNIYYPIRPDESVDDEVASFKDDNEVFSNSRRQSRNHHDELVKQEASRMASSQATIGFSFDVRILVALLFFSVIAVQQLVA